MASDMLQTVSSDWLAIQIQIGSVVSQEHLRMLLEFGVNSDCVAQQEANDCGAQYY